MHAPRPPRSAAKRWRRMSLIFLGLLPFFAVFHAVMWFGFTRTLFRPETGDLKRIGYLVGLEDCKAKLVAQEPQTGFTLLVGDQLARAPEVPVVLFGDSFAASLAKAYSLRTKKPVGIAEVDWESGDGLAQIEEWLADDWFRQHGVKEIVVERVEYAWLDTFADLGEADLDLTWARELAGGAPRELPKAAPWTFANNGNFKVILCNLAYLVSPTAFKMTDTCIVPLKEKMFNCSYGDKLLFYRGDKRGALTDANELRLDKALGHLRDLSELCRAQGLQLRLIVPPVKSYLYYDWVVRPFYPDSKMLEALQARATPFGYVDLKQRFHRELAAGTRDLYFPDDAHWNFPAAEMAAEALTNADAAP
jgi:hypothetical protein